ncbi:hypothetical protein H5410_039252 [Solanum commersonii]|uniref:Uncharacterized protein n=1 Tax=Solanum commersonii TaxID=4109 RepID=A0A9J5YFI8_SOLCO|nr:hypothetical protein H5410_039252 [Solanum commersonii]
MKSVDNMSLVSTYHPYPKLGLLEKERKRKENMKNKIRQERSILVVDSPRIDPTRAVKIRVLEPGQIVETVVLNPPFGTRRKCVDIDFLSSAMKVASQAVYSLHKTTTKGIFVAFMFLAEVRLSPLVSKEDNKTVHHQ